MLNKLKFIENLTPKEVFSCWQQGEGQIEDWQKVAVEKGWNSWEEWRGFCFDQIEGREREWKLYEILEPNQTIPLFLVGPTQSWQKHFDEQLTHTFADLVRVVPEWVKENSGVQKFLEQYPTGAQMIGLALKGRGQIMLFEGHHRAAAVALGEHLGKSTRFEENPRIAISSLSEAEFHLLEDFLARGTKKEE